MKESSFINQNKENWKHYEKVLKEKSTKPDELNDLFIQVTDDLSYSRSFYPNRSVRVYLNGLAQQVFLKLYTNKKRKQSFIVKFFKEELPAILYAARKELLVCFLVFIVTFLVGVFSSRHEAGFARQILGNRYVEMTNEYIKEGKPMNVYAEGDKLSAFLGIAYNNLRVDMLTFATGLLLAIGTLFVLAYNGVMVGVFQYFFYGTGYFTFTVLTIWLHGTLEIFTMILSATAGLVFGKGLVFPGTYTRGQAFRLSAIKGVKILLAVIPLTLAAAFIEAFITGQTNAPLYLKASLIVFSLLFIVFYFVWFPWFKYSKTDLPPEAHELPPINDTKLVLDDIKTAGEVVADTFRIWKKYLNILIPLSFGVGFTVVLATYFSQSRHIQYQFFGVPSDFFEIIKLLKINFWFRDGYYKLWPVFIGVFSLFVVFVQSYFFAKNLWINLDNKSKFMRMTSSFLLITLALFSYYFNDGFLFFALYFFVIFPAVITISSHILNQGFIDIMNGTGYYFKAAFRSNTLNLTLLILLFIFYLVASSPILNFIIEALNSGLKISDGLYIEIQKVIILTLGITTFLGILPLYIFANTLHYFSVKEKVTAQNLRTHLEKIWK